MSFCRTYIRCNIGSVSFRAHTRLASTLVNGQEGVPAVQIDTELRLSAIKLYKEVSHTALL